MLFEQTFREFSGVENALNIENSERKSEVLETRTKLQFLRSDIIGSGEKFVCPFGSKHIIYSDWTASGRAIKSIEKFVYEEVLPHYGNTHTAASITGHQSTCFRAEARQIVGQAVNAKVTGKAAEDVVLFVGNGTTAAVHKIVESLGLKSPLPKGYDEALKPVVFVSSYEHHSNLLPWRESVADVVVIAYSSASGVCLKDLEEQLFRFRSRRLKIGSFSACSNTTGILTNVDEVSILLHLHGAFALFDYASAAPYVKMDMNPVLPSHPRGSLAYKDAIFFSGHKFLGGPGCPGVLVAKKTLLPSLHEAPSESGGGTVFYVTDNHHRYLSNPEEREEAGTPHLIADVKMGLAMNLKQSFGASWIEAEEIKLSKYVQDRLSGLKSVVLLGRGSGGDASGKHLPIFSFLIRCGDRFLHFHFVTALLNDLFGIQSRGGCMCAGPFSQLLLGIDEVKNQKFERLLLEKHEVYRPGYSRLSFPFWVSQSEVDYVIESIAFVAEHGWKFLKLYRYNHKTGEWAHASRLTRFPERKWLSNFQLGKSNASYLTEEKEAGIHENQVLQWFSVMKDAAWKELEALNMSMGHKISSVPLNKGNNDPLHEMQWFLLPEDVVGQEYSFTYLSETISGPIQPPKVADLELRSGLRRLEAAVAEDFDGSAFARQRDKKLKAHTSSAIVEAPRYISLAIASREAELLPIQPLIDNGSKVPNLFEEMIVPVSSMGPQAECSVDGFICAAGDRKILSGPGVSYWSRPTDVKGSNENNKALFHCPPKKIMKLVGQAVKEWDMIREGDRLLLGLSGGKDSLAMLHTLIALKKRAPVNFTIACATVDPQTESFDPSPLIPYMQSLNITYHYLSEPIVSLAKSKMQGDSLCAFCSRFKRGLLYSCCRSGNK